MKNSKDEGLPTRRFFVQKHRARTLHFDCRLEKAGVFKSWAVPKGLPKEEGVKRLAIQVEDHDLDFGDFEVTNPAGEYGAGHVEIWDRGTYEAIEWEDKRIVTGLHGTQLEGRYILIEIRRGGKNAWLIFKHSSDDTAALKYQPDACTSPVLPDSAAYRFLASSPG